MGGWLQLWSLGMRGMGLVTSFIGKKQLKASPILSYPI